MTIGPFPEVPEEVADSREVRLLLILASVLVAVTVAATFAQVVLRYVFNNPQTWAEEVGRYLFVWITFLGAAVAFARDSHIKVDVVVAMFGSGALRIANVVRRLVELLAVATLLYSGIIVAWRNRYSSFYTIPDLPQVVLYLAVPVCSAFMFYYIIRGLVALRR